ncbi:MAG: hypothetical protein JXI43_07450 [Tissierellales bacterium]|nr:hypothetical protein [Tissierellales bacterium]
MNHYDENIGRIIDILREKKEKVVFILGAGASVIDEFSIGDYPVSIPTSENLRQEFIRSLKSTIGLLMTEGRTLDSKYARAAKNLDKQPFEYLLSLYDDLILLRKDLDYQSLTDSKPSHKFLGSRFPGGEQFDNRFREQTGFPSKIIFPPFLYELLAHFMKNRLVNFVISMNWDEMLEYALEEDMGSEGYRRISSLSSFQRYINKDICECVEKERKAFYFKPHGTISYPMTMRFQSDRVEQYEDVKSKVLFEVLKDAYVVTSGYSFLDPDNYKILVQLALEKRIKGLFINKRNKRRQNSYLRSLVTILGSANVTWIEMSSENFALNLYREYQTKRIQPSAIRHYFRWIMFNRLRVIATPRNRFLLELLIYALKTRGQFHHKSLSQHDNLLRLFRIYNQLDYDESRKISPLHIMGLLRKYQLLLLDERKNYWETTYFIPMPKERESDSIEEAITGRIKKMISNRRFKANIEITEDLLEQIKLCVTTLMQEFDCDIVPDCSMFLAFRYFRFIENPDLFNRELTLKTIKLDGNVATQYRIATVTGEWLLREAEIGVSFLDVMLQNLSDEGKIMILLLDLSQDTPDDSIHQIRSSENESSLEIRARIDSRIKIRRNRDLIHMMTMSECVQDGQRILRAKGIYFYREGKNPVLSPIFIESPVKIEEREFGKTNPDYLGLKEMFDDYWERADSILQEPSSSPDIS